MTVEVMDGAGDGGMGQRCSPPLETLFPSLRLGTEFRSLGSPDPSPGLPGSPVLTHRRRRVSRPIAAAPLVSAARLAASRPPRGRGNQPPGSRPAPTNRRPRSSSSRPRCPISGREGPGHRPRLLAPRRPALKGPGRGRWGGDVPAL